MNKQKKITETTKGGTGDALRQPKDRRGALAGADLTKKAGSARWGSEGE